MRWRSWGWASGPVKYPIKTKKPDSHLFPLGVGFFTGIKFHNSFANPYIPGPNSVGNLAIFYSSGKQKASSRSPTPESPTLPFLSQKRRRTRLTLVLCHENHN